MTHAVSLIGMPGVGKSTAGVLLAKATGRRFVDTDVLLQVRTGRHLSEILAAEGREAFLALEEAAVLDLDPRGCVVATGGSVVYSEAAMRHVAAAGPVVHLDLDLARLERRIEDLQVRGVVMAPDETLEELEAERRPLYQRWADLTVDTADRTQDQVVAEIARRLVSRNTPNGEAGR